MNKYPLNVPSIATASSADRDLEHHPLERQHGSVSVYETRDSTLPSPRQNRELPTPDIKVMVTMLNDAVCQVALLRHEVSNLRRTLALTSGDWGALTQAQDGTKRQSVGTYQDDASDEELDELYAASSRVTDRHSAFDWDAWQLSTKARIRRAMVGQSVDAGAGSACAGSAGAAGACAVTAGARSAEAAG